MNPAGRVRCNIANQRFANDWPQPIVNIRWLA
jgi:hypothetical protein